MSDNRTVGNVIAAIASLFVAGLGQLFQGRTLMALIQFMLWAGLWIFMAGWLVTIWSVYDAATYDGD